MIISILTIEKYIALLEQFLILIYFEIVYGVENILCYLILNAINYKITQAKLKSIIYRVYQYQL